MMEKNQWHPVALASDVVASPVGVRLLGEDLVLWRDAQGVAKAFVDRCPHRGARFSLGRVNEGNLECPYHGWQFSTTGQCVKVPAGARFFPPPPQRPRKFAPAKRLVLLLVPL